MREFPGVNSSSGIGSRRKQSDGTEENNNEQIIIMGGGKCDSTFHIARHNRDFNVWVF